KTEPWRRPSRSRVASSHPSSFEIQLASAGTPGGRSGVVGIYPLYVRNRRSNRPVGPGPNEVVSLCAVSVGDYLTGHSGDSEEVLRSRPAWSRPCRANAQARSVSVPDQTA